MMGPGDRMLDIIRDDARAQRYNAEDLVHQAMWPKYGSGRHEEGAFVEPAARQRVKALVALGLAVEPFLSREPKEAA